MLTIFFFAVPTRVHERYLVPVFAVLPILVVADRRWLVALVLLALAVLANLHGVLAAGGLPLGELARRPEGIAVLAVIVTVVAPWAAWQPRSSKASSPDGFDRVSADVAPVTGPTG